MNLKPTEDESMLVELASRWVSRQGGWFARRERKTAVAGAADAQDSVWSGLAETGLLSLNVPVAQGGTGATAASTFLVMEQFGRGAVVEPFAATAVVSVRLLAAHGSAQQRSSLLAGMATGAIRVVPALYEPDSRFELIRLRTRATRTAQGHVLNGRKLRVDGGDAADFFIVSALGDEDRDGRISLFLVDAKAPGLARTPYVSVDGATGAQLDFDQVLLPPTACIGKAGEGLAALEDALDHGLAAVSAEAAGVMAGLLDQCVEHLKTRRQFGRALSDFQALQHRAVEMLVMVSQARSIALAATAQLGSDALTRRRAASAAKSLVGRVGRQLGEQAIQLHGGIGMTDELAAGHYFKRLACIDMTWGDSSHHLQRYAALL